MFFHLGIFWFERIYFLFSLRDRFVLSFFLFLWLGFSLQIMFNLVMGGVDFKAFAKVIMYCKLVGSHGIIDFYLSYALHLGVLSEEQIQLKKLKKQEDDQARMIAVRQNPLSPPSTPPKMTPEQLVMIEKLVAAQQQCNQRSFTDRLKVTVKAQFFVGC